MKLSIKETQEGLDLSVVKDAHVKLLHYKTLIKKLNKTSTPHEYDTLKTKIQTLKKEINNYCTLVYKVVVTNNKHEYYEIYTKYPSKESLLTLKKTFRSMIQKDRNDKALFVDESREMLGFKYKMRGGVFVSKDAIRELAKNINHKERIRLNKVPFHKIKSNYVGVELEFICRVDGNTLDDLLIYEGLAGYVKVTTDGSISRELPGDHAHEIRILAKESDIVNVIQRVCKVLNHPSVGGYVNSSCGVHVHLDARNRDAALMYNNVVRALPMLSKMIPSDRSDNRYCALNTTPDLLLGTSVYARHITASGDPRYQAVNPTSLSKHKTVEVRLHSGSLNSIKINNWVTILSMLANRDTMLSADIKTSGDFKMMFAGVNDKLIKYIDKRTELFLDKKINTKVDHTSAQEFELAV